MADEKEAMTEPGRRQRAIARVAGRPREGLTYKNRRVTAMTRLTPEKQVTRTLNKGRR